MSIEQITNAADNEAIRATRLEDGEIVLEWSPCDEAGQSSDFGWMELAWQDANGKFHYVDESDGANWTEARTNAVNDLLQKIA